MVLTLSGHPILGLPFIPLALFSKEDTAILPVTLAAVLLVRGETWGVAYLAVPLVVLVSRWKAIRIDLTQTGDDGMTAAGFAGAIPQPHYSLTTFVEMMLRYPAWMVGLRNNIDPDIQKIRWDDQRLIVALLVVAAGLEAFWMFPALRMSFVLMAVSPWLLYIFFPMPDPIMEHRAYLSIAGIAVFFVEILKNAPVWLLTLGIAYLAMSCCARAYYWRSSIDLWSAAMRAGSHKKPRVLVNLGAAWQIKGDFRTASEFYDKTLAINPNCAPALVNLAYIAMRDQRIPIAVQWLKTCIERCPRYPLAWNALGQLYRQMNQLEEADRCLKQSEFLMAGG